MLLDEIERVRDRLGLSPDEPWWNVYNRRRRSAEPPAHTPHRVGRDYRLLFRIRDPQLEVLDIVARKDLDAAVSRLRRGAQKLRLRFRPRRPRRLPLFLKGLPPPPKPPPPSLAPAPNHGDSGRPGGELP